MKELKNDSTPKTKQKIFYFQLLKCVKRLSNKLTQKLKKRLSVNLPNQEKLFYLNLFLTLFLILTGW